MKIDDKEFAVQTATEAGDNILMKHHGKMQELNWNTRTHFKTVVDDESDGFIRNRIREEFPDDDVYSEEQDPLNRRRKRKWVYDPLDGTIPYIHGTTDHFSVCISLVEGTTPRLGVIYAPKRGELYVAEKGKGAFCNYDPIKVSLEEEVSHVLMGLDGGKETPNFERASVASYIERAYQSNGIACFVGSGCASVPLALTASGKMHAYVALSLEPWDMSAAVVLNREAGAKVTTIYGKEWELGDPSILVANPKLHPKILDLVSL